MSDCRDVGVVLGCYNDGTVSTTVAVHYTHDHQGAPAVRITDLSGALIAGATLANTALGACAIAPADVEWEMLCDVQAGGTVVEFFRRSITTFNSAGAATVAVTNWALDKVTAYTPTGAVDACPTCTQLPARGIQAAW